MPLIPLGDENAHEGPAWVTRALVAACVAVFFFTFGQSYDAAQPMQQAADAWGFVPGFTLGGQPAQWPNVGWLGLFSSQFLHGDLNHLIGNMLFLWVFGDNIEHAVGRVKFLGLYLAGGAVAALAHAWTEPFGLAPLIGASGAVSALLGAYIVLHPLGRITAMLPPVGVVQVPAWVMLGLWFGYQLFSAWAMPNAGVAFWAHVGGFVFGVMTIRFLVPRKPQLWRK